MRYICSDCKRISHEKEVRVYPKATPNNPEYSYAECPFCASIELKPIIKLKDLRPPKKMRKTRQYLDCDGLPRYFDKCGNQINQIQEF